MTFLVTAKQRKVFADEHLHNFSPTSCWRPDPYNSVRDCIVIQEAVDELTIGVVFRDQPDMTIIFVDAHPMISSHGREPPPFLSVLLLSEGRQAGGVGAHAFAS